MMNDLAITDSMYRLAREVSNKRDFEVFVDSLAADFEINREVWENQSVPEFLLGLADCLRRSTAEPAPHTAQSNAAIASWQYLACLLLGASVVR